MSQSDNIGEKRILVVDDEPQICTALKRILGQFGRIDTASTTTAASDLLGQYRYHMVVADYDVPEKNGIWLLQRVQLDYPQTVRVLYSGSCEADIDTQVASGVIQHFVQKADGVLPLIALVKKL